jgi:hypothetical protein
MNEQTYGQKAVGLSFNPSGNEAVDQIKSLYAEIIDMMDAMKHYSPSPEVKRMTSIAITEAQTSQMWAVKSLTWKD